MKKDRKEKLEIDLGIVQSVKTLPQELYSDQTKKVEVMEDLIQQYGNPDKIYKTKIGKEIL